VVGLAGSGVEITEFAAALGGVPDAAIGGRGDIVGVGTGGDGVFLKGEG
jgi:hypothetical protein